MMEWFQDEDFWRELFPVMFPAERFEAASGQVDQILNLSGVETGACWTYVADLAATPASLPDVGLR